MPVTSQCTVASARSQKRTVSASVADLSVQNVVVVKALMEAKHTKIATVIGASQEFVIVWTTRSSFLNLRRIIVVNHAEVLRALSVKCRSECDESKFQADAKPSRVTRHAAKQQ